MGLLYMAMDPAGPNRSPGTPLRAGSPTPLAILRACQGTLDTIRQSWRNLSRDSRRRSWKNTKPWRRSGQKGHLLRSCRGSESWKLDLQQTSFDSFTEWLKNMPINMSSNLPNKCGDSFECGYLCSVDMSTPWEQLTFLSKLVYLLQYL